MPVPVVAEVVVFVPVAAAAVPPVRSVGPQVVAAVPPARSVDPQAAAVVPVEEVEAEAAAAVAAADGRSFEKHPWPGTG